MADNDEETSTLKLSRFNGKRGEDYGLWRMRLRAVCRVKGVWKVLESNSKSDETEANSSTSDPSTPATASASKSTSEKLEKASAIIISALGDAPLRVVMEADDDPVRMLKLLDARYASNRTVSRIAVQTQLFRMTYNGQNMSSYIDKFTSLFSQLERMGKDAAIPETHKAPMLLASIDPQSFLESTAAALRTKDTSELTWDYVATTLIDEYNARESVSNNNNNSGSSSKTKKKKNKSKFINNSLSVDGDSIDQGDDNDSDIEKTVQAFSAALRSSINSKSTTVVKCEFCGKNGHIEDRCFMNPQNPNNKLTSKMLAAMKSTKSANKMSSTNNLNHQKGNNNNNSKVELAGSVVEKTTIEPPKDSRTYADSGATIHCFFDKNSFVPGSLVPCGERTVEFADKTSSTASLWGQVLISLGNVNLRLNNVLHVPSMGYNLVSTGRLADHGIESLFRRNEFILQLESDQTIIGKGIRDFDSKLYVLSHEKFESILSVCNNEKSDTQLWHRRLAHMNIQDLTYVHKYADGVPQLTSSKESCRACHLGKAHKLPFSSHFKQMSTVGELVHSDMMGSLEMSFPDRFRYVCTFIDDFSRYTFLGFLRNKSDLLQAFEMVKTKFNDFVHADATFFGSSVIQKLHSDGAKEYKSLGKFFGGEDINNTFSPPYTPEHNAIAERINRTLCDAARSILIQANLPACLWPFALKHVIYVRNRVQHSTLKTSPFESITGTRPNLKNVRVFGCKAYVLRLPKGTKFTSRAIEGIYLETLEHGIYKILVSDNDSSNYRIIESRHVTFNEEEFQGAPGLEEIMDDENFNDDTESFSSGVDEDESSTQSIPISISDSEDSINESVEGNTPSEEINCDSKNISEMYYEHSDGNQSEEHESVSGEKHDIDDHQPNDPEHSGPEQRYPRRNRRSPKVDWYVASTAKEGVDIEVTTSDEPTMGEITSATPEEKSMWHSAIEDEFMSLDDKETWVEDDNPKMQPLPTHVVNKIKRKATGIIDRFRSRIVAGGNYQTFGENFFETYAPVISFMLVRVFLYIALCLGMKRAQIDVKTAFLNGILSDDVWVMSPKGIPGRPSRCYKLLKAIYGLKQAHLEWHKRLSNDLKSLGFEELPSAPCVFRLKDCMFGGDVYLLVYVDDILVLSSTDDGIKYVVDGFNSLYEIRVSYDVDWFLGVKIEWNEGPTSTTSSLFFSQPLYTDGILRRFGMNKCKPTSTPMTTSFWNSISDENDKSVYEPKLYEQMIGSLLYLALRSRPDILASVIILARFQKAPTRYCHQAVKRVLRYLQGTSNYGMLYNAGELKIQAFVDSDYAGDITDRKSMTGFAIKLGEATCIWTSKKQPTVVLSTCEAEYHAITMCVKEVLWLRRVISEAGFAVSNPTPLHSDNQGAIKWTESEKCPSTRAKHIDVGVHFVRDLHRNGTITVPYIPSEENDADIFTKPLDASSHRNICQRIGLVGPNEEEC